MEETRKIEVKELNDLLQTLDKNQGYQIGITLFNKDSEIKNFKHYYFTKNFPFADMLRSWKKIRNHIIGELEQDTELAEF